MTPEEIGYLALCAMLEEVNTTPKPGLVDRNNSGAHKDMNFFTFLKSSLALYPYMSRCASLGSNKAFCPPSTLFSKLRHVGKEGEKEMYKATQGVNTQKGIIFLFGLLCSAAGQILKRGENITPTTLGESVSAMTQGIVEKELESLLSKQRDNISLTAGETLYIQYKTTGIRGEVERGLPTLRNVGYPALQQGKQEGLKNDALYIQTLLHLMTSAEDSNILWRGGRDALLFVQKRASSILNIGGTKTQEGQKEIITMDRECIIHNISPGGAADLLAATLFVDFLVEFQKKRVFLYTVCEKRY